MTNKELNNVFCQHSGLPWIMGILNLDSESFYKSSIALQEEEALNKVQQMITDGMAILDVGAFSSKPGMKIPDYSIERNRLIPILKTIHSNFPGLIISVDTMRSEIAKEVFDLGVDIINDISAGNFDPELPKLVGINKKVFIAMHMKGLPENMMHSENLHYENIMNDLIKYFAEKINLFQSFGLHKVIVDPGFGFGKTKQDNFTILRNLNLLEILGKPILAGLSRKSMIWKSINADIENALIGTISAEFYAVLNGCRILRVHDVKETNEMLKIYQQIQRIPVH